VLNILAFAYGALDDPHREQQYFNHLNGILRAIEMSGTGLKEESPWHILMFSHAYDLVASKGYAYNEGKIHLYELEDEGELRGDPGDYDIDIIAVPKSEVSGYTLRFSGL
jgi:hypothetical protein